MFEWISALATGLLARIPPAAEVLTPGAGASPEVGSTDLMTAKPVPKALVIDRKTLRLPEDQYRHDRVPKTAVVIHFTAGTTARSAFNSWLADKRRVGTAYIVDVDGSTFEVFPDDKWAGHLGEGAGLPNEQRTIGIEIANVGPLKRVQDRLVWWPTAKNPWTTTYCRLDETDRYVKASFRGIDYYATFPDVQIDAVCALAPYLCDRYKIPRVLPPADKLTIADVPYFSRYKGVAFHTSFRRDKYDVGPAFPLERLAKALAS